jgi:hypothetical protein
LQGLPKFTQIGIFGLKIKPSGNPAGHDSRTEKVMGAELST